MQMVTHTDPHGVIHRPALTMSPQDDHPGRQSGQGARPDSIGAGVHLVRHRVVLTRAVAFQNSTPAWPGSRCVRYGCLTSRISVTRSANSMSSSGASRPVMTRCSEGGL